MTTFVTCRGIAAAALLVFAVDPGLVSAQALKCVGDGKILYTERECPPGFKQQGEAIQARPKLEGKPPAAAAPAPAPAKKDLVVEMDDGESVRLVGQGDNFLCDDPRYEGKNIVEVTKMQFPDGKMRALCRLEGAPVTNQPKRR